MWFRLFGQAEVVQRVLAQDIVRVVTFHKSFHGILADRLQHPEAQFTPLLIHLLQHAFVHQRLNPVEHIQAEICWTVTDHLRGLQRPAAHEDRETGEKDPLLRPQ